MAINSTAIIESTVAGGNLAVSRFIELVTAPYNHVELLWITIPLIAALIFMDIYFGRYKKEELGWNTAVGNALALMFVSMDLLRHIYNGLVNPTIWNMLAANFKGVLIIFVLAFGSLWLLIADFFHVMPKKLAFMVSSSLPTSLFAYLAIVLIYTEMTLDIYTFLAAILLFIALVIILKIIQFFVPVYLTQKEIEEMMSESR